MFFLFIVFTIVLAIFLALDSRKPKNFPPGPKWYPIIGNAMHVLRKRREHGMLCKAVLAIDEECGGGRGAVSFKVGKDRTVVAMNIEAIREMSSNEDMNGRPTGPFYETRTWGLRRGVILTDEEFWQEQRRFIVRHLKEFGFARSGMIQLIENEAEHLLEDLQTQVRRNNGEPVVIPMQNLFSTYVLNTLWSMMAGVRYSCENVELKQLQRLLNDLFKNIDMTGAPFSHFPFLRFLAPNLSGYQQFVETHATMHAFLGAELNRHKTTYKSELEPRDLMDVYLRVLQSPERPGSFSERQLLAVCLDMFMAGSETTTKALSFAVLYNVRDLECQRKVQQEIDNVVGRERLPNLADRSRLPYCEAAVLEGLRFFVGNTFGIPHRALRDTKLCGYDVPKDTMVVACFRRMMFDAQIWPDPQTYRPERFINQNENKIEVPEQFQPFGFGKRRCMGDLMARSNMFLFFVTLFQNFTVRVPTGEPIPTDNPVDGATPSVRPYTAILEPR